MSHLFSHKVLPYDSYDTFMFCCLPVIFIGMIHLCESFDSCGSLHINHLFSHNLKNDSLAFEAFLNNISRICSDDFHTHD